MVNLKSLVRGCSLVLDLTPLGASTNLQEVDTGPLDDDGEEFEDEDDAVRVVAARMVLSLECYATSTVLCA
jgi:hypothetical protein